MPTQPLNNTSQRCGALHCITCLERKSGLVGPSTAALEFLLEQNLGQPLRSPRNSKQPYNRIPPELAGTRNVHRCSFATFNTPWYIFLLKSTHLCHRSRHPALIRLQPPPFSWPGEDRRPPIGHPYLTRLLLRTRISESHEDVEFKGVWPRWIIRDIFKTHSPIPSPIMHDRPARMASPSTRNPSLTTNPTLESISISALKN